MVLINQGVLEAACEKFSGLTEPPEHAACIHESNQIAWSPSNILSAAK
jgi:hypothetical protein